MNKEKKTEDHVIDYKTVGLKCGLEIHQQLEGKKLFCSCPTTLADDDDEHIGVSRRLRAVIGETGEIDAAAAQEQMRAKTFTYRAYPESCCLVELDEEPPHLMDDKALYTTLQLSKLIDADIVDEVQIMRKTVVDGSNTSGFQRTALVARNGVIETSQGPVKVPTISLEEDAAKIIKRTPHEDIYNLSRLGIPLIEIGTDPDIISAAHCKETALKIGMLLRSTGGVKRGLGSIRQDVNVSIKGGSRVEIKGFQNIDMIDTLIENEVIRQQNILELSKTFKQSAKRIKAVTFHEITDIFKDTKSSLIANAVKKEQHVVGFALPGLANIVGKELQPGRRVGSDLSDYIKVALGLGGLIHSDENLDKYKFTEKEIREVRKRVKALQMDAFVILVGKLETISRGLDVIKDRIEQLANGVPSEVRKPNDDGTTSYQRPMPGADRMYPETDTLPMRVADISIEVPELIDDKIKRYQKSFNLSADLATAIARGNDWKLFEHAITHYNSLKPASIAEALESVPTQLKRKHGIEMDITDEHWRDIFSAAQAGTFALPNATDLFVIVAKEREPISKALERFSLLPEEELKAIVEKVVADNKGAPFGAIMGKVMAAVQGRADGKVVSRLVKEFLK